MKTKEELKEWFWDMYNSCYMVKHDDYPNIENFIRQAKLKTILNEEIIYPTKPNGICLFEQYWKIRLFGINIDIIWSVLETELGCNCLEIRNLINGWLNEHDKLKVLKPQEIIMRSNILNEVDKLTIF